ncbi:Ubiquitin domain-containing protein UBFD1 [Frankliniella fusca]|uniref:Ubiquitin domain-containing protein UBFD1 n=1 Tax=Frankliniella fusca TaxID=407009 RepID=A0AAE1H528_9NEOP|nr:Ubiquitin domain-containing protein UBFD1 [Frankliniella fusca]
MAGTDKGDNEVDSKASKPPSSACGDEIQQSDLTNGSSPADSITNDSAKSGVKGSSTNESVTASCSNLEGAACTSKTQSCDDDDSASYRPRSPDHSPNTEDVDFKVIFSKSKYDITFPLDDTVSQLKEHLEVITGVPRTTQKLMIRGLAKDSSTLREAGVTKGCKVMLVGSKLNDILSVSTPSKEELEDKSSPSAKEPLSKQKMHQKVLEKGVPDDVMPGILNTKEALPPYPLSGMLNKYGGKVRLTFKLELDQVWIGTKEQTQKLSMNSIKSVVSEPIEGHEEYHILGIQLGPTEASRYWVYWVPVQYIDAIKETIMGSWIM